MKIKRLEMLGFKSFSDKTVVNFQHGITGIVGPNGCGKSNIVDAIRWVMGEMSARHLRGKSMEDVIFSGTVQRAPVGMAEVTLVFSTEDGRVPAAYAQFSEIAIRRRLYRSGESEYLINQTPCRLKDIHDLFLGTGVGVRAYSIIEQGHIGQVISSKPEERRVLLEEAAGISKFKNRKEAALRKIESTRANLLRLSDIINELKRQMNSLDRQARKAQRYQETFTELREAHLTLGAHEFKEWNDLLSQLESESQKLTLLDEESSADIATLENTLEQLRLHLQESEQTYMQKQEQIYEKNNSIQLHQTNIQFKTREVKSLDEQAQAHAQEIQVAKDRLSSIKQKSQDIKAKQEQLENKLLHSREIFLQVEQELEQRIHAEKSIAEKIENSNTLLFNNTHEISQHKSKIENAEQRETELTQRFEKNQSELENTQQHLKKLDSEYKSKQKELSILLQNKLELEEEKKSLELTLDQHKQSLEKTQAQLDTYKEELSQKNSRFESLMELERNFEGYQEGVRNILKHGKDKSNEIFGIVADFIATESQYEAALSAALGERLQSIVVQDINAAVNAIRFLKHDSSGRASCIPLELHPENSQHTAQQDNMEIIKDNPNILGPLLHFVQCKTEYKALAHVFLQNIFLVSDIESAQALWKKNESTAAQFSFVSLDGEFLSSTGFISGGAQNQNEGQSLLKNKREIKQLESALPQLKQKITEYSFEIQSIQERIKKIESTLEQVSEDKHSKELKRINFEKDIQHLESERTKLQERQKHIESESTLFRGEKEKIQNDIAVRQTALVHLEQEREKLQQQIHSYKDKLETEKSDLEAVRSRLYEEKSQLSHAEEHQKIALRDLESLIEEKIQLEKNIAEKEKSIQHAETRIRTLQDEIAEDELALHGLTQNFSNDEIQLQDIQKQIQNYNTDLHTQELQIREKRKHQQELRAQLQKLIVEVSEYRSRIQMLREQIFERYQVDVEEMLSEYLEKECNQDEFKPRIQELKTKLDKIGHVNLDAISEFDEAKTRFEFLEGQYQDLENSLEKLLQALQKVNRTTKKYFRETFEKVNELFQKVFPQLFRGGQAELRLTDPENLLETGVDIIAQPPGKRLQNVNLLSGGEKALTAISLVFAIFLIKPSPFCLLDEVDAPLDDVNIDRFNEMVRSMTDRSQFIIITHNKRTMELANVLYGITMEQAGVSKLVSVEIQDADQGTDAA